MSTLKPTIPGNTNHDIDDANVDTTMRPADSTMRPADSTMRPADSTVRPADSTVRPADITGRPADTPFEAKTMRPATPMASSGDEVLVADGDYFLLKGERYRNLECLSDNSGEAQVFLVSKDGKEYVLKVYYPNFDVNKKLLQTIYNFDFEMVVSLLDYGKTYVDGKHRSYELITLMAIWTSSAGLPFRVLRLLHSVITTMFFIRM